MAFIPESQVTIATGQILAQFDWASRAITIYKEPTQNIISQPVNPLYGYGGDEQSNSSEITYTSVSAVHSGIIIYPFETRNQSSSLFDNKVILKNDATYIKLKQNGRDYLMNGTKNEKLEFDGQTWNLEGGKYQVQTFCGLNFYYFEVKGTN